MAEGERRTTIGMDGSQVGEVRADGIAGNDIHYHGLPPEQMGPLLERAIVFRDELLRAYEHEIRELRKRFERFEDDRDVYRELERDRRESRQRDTDKAQAELAENLAALSNAAKAQAQELARQRRLIGGLIIALLLIVAALGWLLADRLTGGGLARMWLGAGIALALSAFRP